MITTPDIGWKYVKLKQGTDLNSNTFAQFLIYEYVREGALDKHIEMLKDIYAKRCNLMQEAIRKYFPPEVRWVEPKGGLFLWIELPGNIDTYEILPRAVENNVAYVPGTVFYPAGGGNNTCRLNFSKPSEAEIETGIERLANLFKSVLTD